MTTADTKVSIEDTFASKLGIEMVTPRTFEKMIEINAGTRTVVCAIGPSGIGKTAIPMQIAKRRNNGKGVPYVPIYMPTATQEGFFIPTTASDTKVYFDQRIPRPFQPLLEWATALEKKYGIDKAGKSKIPKDMCPILAIEELNRTVDKSVTRAVFTLIGDRMIGDVHLPDCIQIIATMNPTGNGMNVNEFERDPAMSRRLQKVGVMYNYGDFIQYATNANFHPDVIAHLGAQPSHVYDEQAALAGKTFACPATWEGVSNVCWQFQEMKISLLETVGRASVSGLVGTGSANAFLDFVKDHTLVVTPEDVLTLYGGNSEIQKRFKSYLTEGGGRFDKVTELTEGIAVHVFANLERKIETISKPLSHFIGDLPVEIMMAFIQRMTDESNRVGNDGKNYLGTLNVALAKEPEFTAGLRRLHEAKQAVEAEPGTKAQ